MLTPQDIQIAAQRAIANSIRDIAVQVGTSKSTVARKLDTAEVKALIERIQSSYVSDCADLAAANHQYAIAEYIPQALKSKEEQDYQLREHGYKASTEALRAIGVLVANTSPIYIQQIYNDNHVEISPVVSQMMGNMFSFLGVAGPAKVDNPVDNTTLLITQPPIMSGVADKDAI